MTIEEANIIMNEFDTADHVEIDIREMKKVTIDGKTLLEALLAQNKYMYEENLDLENEIEFLRKKNELLQDILFGNKEELAEMINDEDQLDAWVREI